MRPQDIVLGWGIFLKLFLGKKLNLNFLCLRFRMQKKQSLRQEIVGLASQSQNDKNEQQRLLISNKLEIYVEDS